MSSYLRNYVYGGTYFFTLVTRNRIKIFNDSESINAFLTAVETIRGYHHFEIIAYCVLPDHIHLLLKLEENDRDFSSRVKEIKKKTTRLLRQIHGNNEMEIWQNRFWEHTIKDENDLNVHFDYIYYNPVKHGYVDDYKDWEWSSYRDHYPEANEGHKIDHTSYSNHDLIFGE